MSNLKTPSYKRVDIFLEVTTSAIKIIGTYLPDGFHPVGLMSPSSAFSILRFHPLREPTLLLGV